MKKIIFVFMFICVLLCCEKSSTPSMQETIDWLQQTFTEIKIREEHGYVSYDCHVAKDSIYKEMMLRMMIKIVTDTSYVRKAIQIPLKRVHVFADTSQYDSQLIFLGFKTKNNEERIGIIDAKGANGPLNRHDESEYSLPILYNNDNMLRLKKMVRAIQHLIKLVGGNVPKKELF